MKIDPEVWGKHYWFFLHTTAYYYPKNPSSVTKRKYYDLIQNIPLFIPNPEMGDYFAYLINMYPISPYLDNRDSFIRWVWFIHNKINKKIGKPEISLYNYLDAYHAELMDKKIKADTRVWYKEHLAYTSLIVVCVCIIYLYQ
jgi:hypothetical protein